MRGCSAKVEHLSHTQTVAGSSPAGPTVKIWRARRSVDGYTYKVPVGAEVEVVRNFPRKRVLVRYQGELILTLQGCLRKP